MEKSRYKYDSLKVFKYQTRVTYDSLKIYKKAFKRFIGSNLREKSYFYINIFH